MKIKSILWGVVAAIFSSTVSFAHSDMKTTSPAHEAKLDVEPEMLHLTFAKPARVLKVVMTHSTQDTSNEVRVELPTKEAVEEIRLTPQFMGPGNYKIEWRALGDDGHVLTGEFTFEVAG